MQKNKFTLKSLNIVQSLVGHHFLPGAKANEKKLKHKLEHINKAAG